MILQRSSELPPAFPPIGRDEELAQLERWTSEGGALISVVGSAGIGKTRIAQELLRRLTPQYDALGGAWFCDLREVHEASFFLNAVAAVVVPEGGAPAQSVEALAGLLASREGSLLVLDNFEQLMSAAPLLAELHRLAPQVRIVLTSRERTGIASERVFELGPLSAESAIALFKRRADDVGAHAADDETLLGTLVDRLDHLPLAIELAADRATMLSIKQLLDRVGKDLSVLRSSAQVADTRHATLYDAINSSWQLLSDQEQRALAECSIFSGDFSIEAAEQVLSFTPGDLPVIDVLESLRHKSMIQSARIRGRLSLYVSTRAFAADKRQQLSPAAQQSIHLRHLQRYAAMANELNLDRTCQSESYDASLRMRALRDKDNLLAALSYARTLRTPEAQIARTQLAIAVWHLHAASSEYCLHELTTALEFPALDVCTRALTLLARASIHNSLGRGEASRTDLDAVLALPELPRSLLAWGYSTYGVQHWYHAEFDRAWAAHCKAEALLGNEMRPRMRAINTACMGRLQCEVGNAELGRLYNKQSRALCIDIGDRWIEGMVVGNLAQLEQEQGNLPLATELAIESIEHFASCNEQQYIALYRSVLGDILHEAGKRDEARAQYAQSARILAGWRSHRARVQLYTNWAAMEAQSGQFAEADKLLAYAHAADLKGGSSLARFIMQLHEARTELLRARAASDARRMSELRSLWTKRLADADAGNAEGQLLRYSMDLRFARRMLDAVLDSPHAAGGSSVATVLADGSAFKVGAGQAVDLQRRGALRRILQALAAAQQTGSGMPLSASVLIAHGWPNERLLADAAGTRLRVAISTLRKLGLKDALRTRDDGYVLDPAFCSISSDLSI